MSQAIESFVELRRLFPNHEPLNEYLVQITHSVRYQSTDDNFMFFLKLPARTQKEILSHSAEYHEMNGEYLDACRIYVLLLKAYPETVAFYGSHAAQLAIKCENKNQPLSVSNPYRKILVEDILPEILHQKILVYDNSLPPEIQIYQPKTSKTLSTSSTLQPNSAQSRLHVTYNQLKSWLERAQGFYIAIKDWKKLFEVSLGVMDSCGYLRFESSHRTTMVDLFDDSHKLPSKLFSLLNQKQATPVNQPFMMHDSAPHPFAVSIGIACFVLCCHEFYEYVAGLKSKRTCLIPVFPIGQLTVTAPPSPPQSTFTSPITSQSTSCSYIHHLSCDDQCETRVNKRRRLSVSFLLSKESNEKADIGGGSECENYIDNLGIRSKYNIDSINDEKNNKSEKYKGNSVMNVINLLINNDDDPDLSLQQKQDSNSKERSNQKLNTEQINLWHESYISSESIIHDATSHIERALICWQLLEKMVLREGNDPKILDQELENHIKSWDLPLDVTNSIILTRGDLALSRGSWHIAYTFCQKICTRIEGAWDAHRKKVSKKEQSPPLSSPTYLQKKQHSIQEESLDLSKINDCSVKEQTPLLLTFRVIYSISKIYLLIGWWREARKELLMILATIPFTPVTQEHFKKDDWCTNKTIESIGYDEGYKQKHFKLMEVTQEGLVVRTIKELMICYENELSSFSHQQLDIDNTLGHIVVLIQYGWPYWRDRLFRPIILPRIIKHGGLNYPDMLRFVYNIEILREIYELHRIFPDLNFSLLKQSSTSSDQLTDFNTTKASIQALEDKINHPSSRSNNEKLVEFCKERLIHLQNNTGVNLHSDLKNDKAKDKEIISRSRYASGYDEKFPDNSDKTLIGEIDMKNSQITNIQETQTKSWKMNVSSIVAVDNMNNNSCNYDRSNSLHNNITKVTKTFETSINASEGDGEDEC
ncbi:hypothetical protein C1645_731491 [Glomus cerebriforme]|uniref:Integrator complex subunit 10 n=1 Tax=Glomus cerebriforme TaxID=658196 RepID=A0A397TQ74_9GLOM|nr:hypothetical protein C1645_731491 [Glomus cerebriforme]